MQMRILTLALAVSVLPAVALAAVYKWTDSEGNVHYTQTPPPDQKAETVETHTGVSADEAKQNLEALKQKAGDKGAGEQAAPEQTEEQKKVAMEQEELRKKNCEVARQNLQVLQGGGRVQVKDEGGNTVLLDDAAMKAKLEESRAYIKENCR